MATRPEATVSKRSGVVFSQRAKLALPGQRVRKARAERYRSNEAQVGCGACALGDPRLGDVFDRSVRRRSRAAPLNSRGTIAK